jgi:hypothetical protein
MERVLRFEEPPAPPPPAPPPPPPSRREPPAPDAAPPPPPEPPPRPLPAGPPADMPARSPAFWREPDGPGRHVTIRAVTQPAPPPRPAEPLRPRLGPPPERPRPAPAEPEALPAFITEPADATTQIVCGAVNGGSLAFGFYPDGNIRLVDVDGGRYAGKADSARARMREVDGMRAFTVQIGVAADQRLQATFTGGSHDAETIALEPLVGWSVA